MRRFRVTTTGKMIWSADGQLGTHSSGRMYTRMYILYASTCMLMLFGIISALTGIFSRTMAVKLKHTKNNERKCKRARSICCLLRESQG